MENQIGRQYTLAELEPGWPEDLVVKRTKSSPRMQGSMRMALRRVSRTPENSRVYVPGDPVGLIDWKAFGRTDELIIREHRDEASARVKIVIDMSPTLLWPTQKDTDFHGGISKAVPKIELAIRLALYFAHAHLSLGDSVSLFCADLQEMAVMSWSPKAPGDILRVYETCRQQGFLDGLVSFMGRASQQTGKFDVSWFMSDFLASDFLASDVPNATDDKEVLVNFESLPPRILDLISAKSVRVLHIFSWIEACCDWMDGATSYRDEKVSLKVYMGDQLRQQDVWQNEIKRWRDEVGSKIKSSGGSYLCVNDNTKVSELFQWVTKEVVLK